MLETINEKVSVILKYDRVKNLSFPLKIRWQGKDFLIIKVCYYHKIHQGKIVLHVFDVTDGNLDFRLSLNGDNLTWTLEEVSDGSTN